MSECEEELNELWKILCNMMVCLGNECLACPCARCCESIEGGDSDE